MSKKVLFLPNDLGGGLGHLRRCLEIAEELHKVGWKIGVITHRKKNISYIPHHFNNFYTSVFVDGMITRIRSKWCPIHPIPRQEIKSDPLFWELNDLNYQVLRDGYFIPDIVKRRFRKLKLIIEKWKPDVLIGDAHILTYFLGRHFQIPVVQIIRSFAFPEHPRIIWWKPPPSLLSPNITPIFEPFIEQLGLPHLFSVAEMLVGDAYLVPAFPEFEPITTTKPLLYFGYHITPSVNISQLDINKKKPVVYITFGGGAKRGGLKLIYQLLINFFADLPYQVLISDPFRVIKSQQIGKNMIVFPWIENSQVLPKVDLVIHHGGYATTLESLFFRKPSLILPSHSEQEGNGKRLERFHAGSMLAVACEPYEEIYFDYKYGSYSIHAGFKIALTNDALENAISNLIEDGGIQNPFERLSNKLKNYYNPCRIIEFLSAIAG